jgi:hypothetical protein
MVLTEHPEMSIFWGSVVVVVQVDPGHWLTSVVVGPLAPISLVELMQSLAAPVRAALVLESRKLDAEISKILLNPN